MALDLSLPPAFVDQARVYLQEIEQWSRAGRLTGYGSLEARVRHLLIESLMLLAAIPPPGTPLLDIGTGPGIPGLVVKLVRPAWDVVLMEASRRRVNFLRHVSRTLGLGGIEVVRGRAEGRETAFLAARFQTVAMRAVVPPPEAGPLAARFLRDSGVLVLPVGPAGPAGSWPGARVVTVGPVRDLPGRRRFLIISRTELEAGVSRGTGERGPRDGDRQPEGRRRQDDDGG